MEEVEEEVDNHTDQLEIQVATMKRSPLLVKRHPKSDGVVSSATTPFPTPTASLLKRTHYNYKLLSLNAKKCNTKRFMKILIYFFLFHVTLISIYNQLQTPDTCQVAKLSKIKLQSYARRQGEDGGDDDSKSNNDFKYHVNKNFNYTNTLPKIIHHQWKDASIPSKYHIWHQQWKIYFPEPEFQHILWTDEAARNLIEEKYNWFLETYDNYDMNIKRADASRYFILHSMGGIYSDLDYEPLVNFYEYLPQNQVGIIESPYKYNEQTQNSFMSSPKQDPFWIHVLEGLGPNANRSVLHATGPKFLDRMISSNKEDSYILPCENFHRIPYGSLRDSKWYAVLAREFVTRVIPMSKQCGKYWEENSCQFGKHHNAAGWTSESLF